VWETEEEDGRIFQGIVEKAVRNEGGRGGGGGSGKSYDTDGTIRVLLPEQPNEEETNIDSSNNNNGNDNKNGNVDKKGGPLVRLRAGEYTGEKVDGTENTNNNNINSRLFRGDLVEFRILVDRRTKQKYARYIKLVQSEKERSRIEKEKKLLENATAEEGIIVSLNKGFGFIKSNRRREDVYFHYSNVVLQEETANGDRNTEGQQDELQLRKGQEVKFLVVTESDGQNSGNSKCSARQVECLPAGSVVFHTVEATGVKGMVTMVPHPPSAGSKGDDSKEGKIRLLEPIKVDGAGEDAATTVDEVLLHYSDAPGGVFTYQNHRNQSINALWIYEGDILLFDVIKETVDGSYRAIPTLHTIGLGGTIEEPNQKDVESEKAKPVMRMLATTSVGRAEGVLHTIKNDYGFIHFSERPIDVHFKMYDLLPDEIQQDIRKQMGIEGPVTLEVGGAVQFDICAHGNITSSGGNHHRGRHGRGGNNSPHERENIRGQRIVVLPKSAVVVDKTVATGVKGVVKVTDPKQLYAGSIDLEEEAKPMSLDERHPLVAQMLDAFLEESSQPNGRKALVYRDTLSMKDDDIVVEMAKLKGKGLLECSHIPIPGIGPHPGRLCIRRVEKEGGNEEATSTEGALEAETGKKGKKDAKPKSNLRFDKSSLLDELKDDVPPAPGDVVSCDIVQSRRTGSILVRNMKIIERKNVEGEPVEVASANDSGIGVIKDVVPKRNFGFISVLDDNAVRRELLFFHLPKDRRGGGLRKGDEVKFDIGMEGAKRIATNVKKVPKGTIPSAASKNACLGYILMEPSHTSLSDTPFRKTHSSMSSGSDKIGNSRWVDTKDESKKTNQVDMPEQGCILLLEDKTGMFQKKQQRRRGRKKRSESVDSTDSMDDASGDDLKSVGSSDDLSSDGELSSDGGSSDNDAPENKGIVNVLSHLGYRNGSIAIHGSGATSAMDGSTNPRRGDLVSFVKGRKRNTVRDIRVESRHKATLLRGRLEDIKRSETEDGENKGTAKFIAATEREETYDIDLVEVVSCDAKVLKEKESVEGVLHEGKIFGICRTCDLYLSSKLGTSHKERPKLNLTVKKDRGGTIIAQSMMAKGPDGTNGFKTGWTKRTCRIPEETS